METKYVIIPDFSGIDNLGIKKKGRFLMPNEREKSPFELAIETNKSLYDSLMVIGQVSNFRFSRNILMQLGIYQYEEIIEACAKNSAADFAFAAFASNPDDILLVTNSLAQIKPNDYYYNTLVHAKNMAAKGDIILIDFYQGELVTEEFEKIELKHRIYCFQAASLLDELNKHEPDTYNSVKRAHFKKSGSFINEILNELIPNQSIESAVLDKSEKVKIISASVSDLEYTESNWD